MPVSVPVEMKLLMAAVIVGFVQIVWAAVAGAAGGNRPLVWLAGPRDDSRPAGVIANRLNRALANFLETFPLFAAALLACAAVGKLGGGHTVYGAMTYVVARALYVPLYAFGVPFLRTLVWTASILGIVAIIIAFFH